METIKQTPQNGKKGFRGIFEGWEVVAKHWPKDLAKRYYHLPPSQYFAKMLAYSDTILSHFLKPGYLLVITQEEGIPLGYTMLNETPKAEKKRIGKALIEAIKVLRGKDPMHKDDNRPIFCGIQIRGELILLDLEIMWQNYDGDPADEVDVSGVLGLDENYDTDEEDGSSG